MTKSAKQTLEILSSDVITIKITDNNYVFHSGRTWHSHKTGVGVYIFRF